MSLERMASVAYSNKSTLQNTFELARACAQSRIPGVFVECGVAAGAQIGAMGLACAIFSDRRQRATKRLTSDGSLKGRRPCEPIATKSVRA